MDVQTPSIDPEIFDERAYLRLYPDVADAISRNDEVSGWNHYEKFGFNEGRRPNDLDVSYYLATYPLAQLEISRGTASNAIQHYFRFGRARGYLAHAAADRVLNPAGHTSPFGGLWIDQPHVHDLIDGKLETGQLNPTQAEQLRFFVENGYLILENAVPSAAINAARTDLDRAYNGLLPKVLFECAQIRSGHVSWDPRVKNHPAKVIDLHYGAPTMLPVMFAAHITTFLGLIFESKAFASQSLGFLRGSAQEGHQDSAYVVYTLPRHFAASWIALEDVTAGAGELFYYPGSHRFSEFRYGGVYKSIFEARRMGVPKEKLDRELVKHVESLENRARALGLKKALFSARAGDALIWHSDLVHGGNPISGIATRKSLVTHYCPRYSAPSFCETRKTSLDEYDGHFYTSGNYD